MEEGEKKDECYSYSILGTGKIDKPINYTHNTSEDGKPITHFWEHSSKAIVSHYILTLVAAEDGSQIFEFNVTSTSITIPSTSVDLNGSLSAVSVCGDKSDPVLFQGNNNYNVCSKC